MRAIFDVPMGSQYLQEAGRASLSRSQAGNAIDDLLGAFEGMSGTSALCSTFSVQDCDPLELFE